MIERMKSIGRGLLGVVLLLMTVKPALAIVDPREVVNNRVGVHIVDENDLNRAAEMVNGNGGEWGYVKMVITENDRVVEKWQAVFDRMRELKLIPIIRLATRAEGSVWLAPKEEQIRSWIDFFEALNWVVENRYVVLFNEPNHAKEWSGRVDANEYTRVVKEFARQLHEFNHDYFVMMAGLDLSAGNTEATMEATDFLRQMWQTDAEIFKSFDGWASHSYPNPDFSASPYNYGRNSIRGYAWELDYAGQYGFDTSKPVFITETGWVHNEGKMRNRWGLEPETVADYYKYAFENAWNDSRIVAVTPFILNYQDAPFDHFSFVRIGGEEVYPQFEAVREMEKVKGEPEQLDGGEYVPRYFPGSFALDSNYQVAVKFMNVGQAIWEEEDTELKAEVMKGASVVEVDKVGRTPPRHVAKTWLKVRTALDEEELVIRFWLERKGERVSNDVVRVIEIEENTLILQLKLWMEKIIYRGELLT